MVYLFKVNSECKVGRSDISDFSDFIGISCKESVVCFQIGGFLIELELVQIKKEDCVFDLLVSGLINNLVIFFIFVSYVEDFENMNIICLMCLIDKFFEKGRYGIFRGGKELNSKGMVYFFFYWLVEFMFFLLKKIIDGFLLVYKFLRNE